jgi:hypothetical protein
MQNDDNELEKYLSEFRPRAVRMLRAEPEWKNPPWMGRLAAATILAALAGTGLWHAAHKGRTERAEVKELTIHGESGVVEPAVNSITLTRIALTDPQHFEEKMSEASRVVLPDLRDPQSTLSVLTK